MPGFSSSEEVEDKLRMSLSEYKAQVDKLNLYPSDKKKLLSLPFYLAKRSEDPTPREGQSELELFKEMTGSSWYANDRVLYDQETKITEFDYEKYLNPLLLKDVDTDSEDFKTLIKVLNHNSKTKFEKLEAQKKSFQKIMNCMGSLNDKEQRALIHLVKNRHANVTAGREVIEQVMDSVVD